jgi:1,4-alpha-glucan branching enzyme
LFSLQITYCIEKVFQNLNFIVTMRKIFSLFSLVLVFCSALNAQVIYTEPTFPADNEKVVVYFDATKGTGGLNNCNCDVYVHTGVVTNLGNNWRYVKTQWGIANDEWKMEKIGANLYKYELKPTVRDYYGVPAGEQIVKLAFVFRNANGSAEGKDDGGKDIFYDMGDPNAFTARLITPPASATVIKNKGETIAIKGEASLSSKLLLIDNGQLVKEVLNAKEINHTITANDETSHVVAFTAIHNTDTITETFTYFAAPAPIIQDPPASAKLGAIQNGNDITLLLNAKNKQSVFVIGDFSDWKLKPENLMRKSTDGTKWWIELKNLPNGVFKYQYVVDGNLKIADPHSEVILDEANDKGIPANSYPNLPAYPSGKTAGYVSVLEIPRKTYNWQVTNFQRPARTDLVIYELLVRDFTTQRNIQAVIDSLDYLKRLGINAVQLMPVNEFDNNQSWGYNPTYHHALDKYYASPEIFKKFVDECHKRGMAVIIDVVFNHVSEKGAIAQLYPISNSPYVNQVAKHPFNVFLDLNHESPETRAYVDRCLQFWLEEYRIDGYRFDLSKGFTQTDSGSDVGKWGKYDAGRIATLKHYADIIKQTSSDAYPILEHFGEKSEEQELTDNGMMVWQNANYAFGQAIMGYSGSDISSTYYARYGFKFPHAVSYAESHDEERNMYRAKTFGNANADYSTKDINTALSRSEAAAMFLFAIPGPKMIWQFGELGYDYSINDCGNGTVNNSCRLSIKPTRWDYYNEPNRRRLFDVYSNMINLKKTVSIFKTDNVTLYVSGLVKQAYLSNADLSLVAFGNFNITEETVYPDFPTKGIYYEYFTGDSINVTATDEPFQLKAGSYRLYSTKKLPKPSNGYFTSDKNLLPQIARLNVFPNPTLENETSILTFELQEQSFVSINITDLSGKIVQQVIQQRLELGNHQFSILEDLPRGTYIITIKANQQTMAKKVMKF